jgi:hypothetical protein
MSAYVSVAGWEAWCQDCLEGSGVTEEDEAREWAKKHNDRKHLAEVSR